MRILFFADNFPPEMNAQASRVYERARYWTRWGHSVTVVTCAPNFPEGRLLAGYKNLWYQTEQISGIRIVRIKTYITANRGRFRRMADYLSFLPMAVLAAMREEVPDIVAATSPQMFAGMAGWIVAQLLRRPFLLEVSDLWPESVLAVGAMQKRNLVIRGLSRMASFLYNRADRIVVLTEAFRERIVSIGVPEKKIEVILNGVDLEQFRPRTRDVQLARQWGIQATDFVVGYIGTLGMAHGLENVLRAAEYLGGGRVRFLFVGPGAEREHLRAIAAEWGLKNVVFVPAQPKEQMPRYWSLCDVALVHLKDTPLFATVIPSKLFEAMGMGLPIVLVAPRGEASKIVLGKDVGIHVPAGDANALATALASFEKMGDGLKEIAGRSRSVAQNYSRERQAGLYLTSLERASARGPAPKENTYESARL